MQVISLFSGIGGFELAAEWAGWQNIVSCEINQFGRKVLDYYWPNAYHHDDIHTLTYEKIDQELTKRKGLSWRSDDIVLTGGFPCQPYSAAGKRLGKEDDRHLWPEMLRIIREVQPKWIVGENVLGLVNWSDGLVFDEVQADLEAEGYEVQAYVLPAAAVNAPHRRDRVWFVAYSDKCTTGPSRTSGETKSNGSENNDEQSSRGKQTEQHNRCSDVLPVDTNANGKCLERCETTKRKRGEHESIGAKVRSENRAISQSRNATNPERKRQQEQRQLERPLHTKADREWKASWTYDDGRWPTQSPICSGNDGISNQLDGITFPKWRNESIKAYGNAIVPQVVYQIFKAINEYERTTQIRP